MTFAIKDWVDAPSTTTPISAVAVEDLETRVTDYADTLTANAQTGTAYTLVLADRGKVVELTNAAAIALTIPTNAVAAFPIGATVEIYQGGAGAVTFSGAGVTIRSRGNVVITAGIYAVASLRKRATNEWSLSGDLI